MLTLRLLREIGKEAFELLRERKLPKGVSTGAFTVGYCPICEKKSAFVIKEQWLRDHYRCILCFSIPRNRALIYVLETHFPKWRELKIHESSPGSPSSDKLRQECQGYTASHFFPDTPLGAMKDGVRCENLERLRFGDGEFDLLVTQDVFEHVLNPAKAFSEVARVLREGGAHVYTVPWYYWKETLVRAVEENGAVKHLVEPDYHGNPIDEKGSLVITEWGRELCDFIYKHSGLTTTIMRINDKYRGIDAEFIEVFISQKHAARSGMDDQK